ncbi:MAG: sulfatase-like hydrolase/transferase [Myxococcota bacterium]
MRFLAILSLSVLFSTPVSAAESDRELIFLILIDAVRADSVGSYGYEKPTTPTLDRLAGRGVRYTRAYVNAPWTRASTASYFTGLNGSRHRTETDKSKLPKGTRTLARRLRDAGWRTTGFSANGNGGAIANLDEGFHLYEDPSNAYSRKETRKRCQAKYGKTIPAKQRDQAIRDDCVRYVGLPTGEFMVHRTLEHLKTSKAKKEFIFLFLVDPHDHNLTYFAPPRLEKMFLGHPAPEDRPRVIWEKNNDYSKEHRRIVKSLYDAGIRYSDEAVAQLIAGLGEEQLKNTTMFISADHGEGFGEHDFYLHAHHFWEEVIHVPLIALGPRFSPSVDERLTQSLDVTATILELAGADTKGLPGQSLLKPAVHDHIISEYNEYGIHRQAIIGERYKVIWQRPADEKWYMSSFPDRFTPVQKKSFFPSVSFGEEVVRVFDLKKDPGEKNDLSATMPPEAAALLQTLRSFVQSGS